jgi:anti-sigma factor RsiW
MSATFHIGSLRSWLRRQRFLAPMGCAQVRCLLPGYLDGALPERAGQQGHTRVAQHLEGCAACRAELQSYRELSTMMSSIRPAAPPEQLGVTIRNAISQARAVRGFAGRMRRWKSRAGLVLENILEPLALPATGGVLVALLVFGIVYQVLAVGMPLSVSTADSPTNLLQPARLLMLAGFETSTLAQADRAGEQHGLLVEATVNAEGQAVSYRVISGEVDAMMRRQLDQVVLFSRFRPQMNFGRPTSGGHVILSFSQILVRG